MHWLGPMSVLVIRTLLEDHTIRLKLDWDSQSVRHKLCITALLVQNQTVKDLGVSAKSGSGSIASEYPLRTGGDRRRIKSSAHKDGHVFRSQPVGDGAIEQLLELLDAIARPFV